ncbi:MAG TPA: hypothetical protein VF495_27225 [Phenylobacterium sp.]
MSQPMRAIRAFWQWLRDVEAALEWTPADDLERRVRRLEAAQFGAQGATPEGEHRA